MRGNQPQLAQPGQDQRSIPACAGEPIHTLLVALWRGVYPRVCGGTGRDHTDSSGDTVYPRVCGGTGAICNPAFPTYGLSPRVRGNRDLYPVDCERRGSIPACAGEPALCVPICIYTVGLSPRVRGNQADISAVLGVYRSIPACAGEPSRASQRSSPTAVYPRVCGGTFPAGKSRMRSEGLSPRVRGNRVQIGGR